MEAHSNPNQDTCAWFVSLAMYISIGQAFIGLFVIRIRLQWLYLSIGYQDTWILMFMLFDLSHFVSKWTLALTHLCLFVCNCDNELAKPIYRLAQIGNWYHVAPYQRKRCEFGEKCQILLLQMNCNVNQVEFTQWMVILSCFSLYVRISGRCDGLEFSDW